MIKVLVFKKIFLHVTCYLNVRSIHFFFCSIHSKLLICAMLLQQHSNIQPTFHTLPEKIITFVKKQKKHNISTGKPFCTVHPDLSHYLNCLKVFIFKLDHAVQLYNIL